MRRSRTEGFTLVEVMMASVILVIVSVGFGAGMLAAMRTHRASADYYKAASIARNRIQRAKVLDFNSMATLAENDTHVNESGNIDDGSAGRFRRTTTITYVYWNCVNVDVKVCFPMPFQSVSTAPVELNTMINVEMCK